MTAYLTYAMVFGDLLMDEKKPIFHPSKATVAPAYRSQRGGQFSSTKQDSNRQPFDVNTTDVAHDQRELSSRSLQDIPQTGDNDLDELVPTETARRVAEDSEDVGFFEFDLKNVSHQDGKGRMA